MSHVTMALVGLPQLQAKLAALSGPALTAKASAALTAAAMEVQNAAKALVPRQTSTLMRSIVVSDVTESGSVLTVTIGPTVEYGVYVEFGTGIYAVHGDGRKTPWTYKRADGRFVTTQGNRAKPYLRPAFDEAQGRAIQVFRLAFLASLREVTA